MGKASDNLSIQETHYAWAYHKISVLFLLFFMFSLFFFQLLRGRDSYFFIIYSEFNADLKQIKVILSTVKTHRIFFHL